MKNLVVNLDIHILGQNFHAPCSLQQHEGETPEAVVQFVQEWSNHRLFLCQYHAEDFIRECAEGDLDELLAWMRREIRASRVAAAAAAYN